MCVEVFVKLFQCFLCVCVRVCYLALKCFLESRWKFVKKKKICIVKNKNVISIGYASHSFHVFR